MVVLVKFEGRSQLVNKEEVLQHVANLGLPAESVYLTNQGKIVRSFENLEDFSEIQVFLSLRGGKGGFGAKLKTEGGKKVRPNDNMYSRDIQGRPIAYATVEK